MSGAELIAAERQRQIDAEGWTPEHDDSHVHHEIAEAARCYVSLYIAREFGRPRGLPMPTAKTWPEGWEWKPSDDPIHNLVRAGALIAAEIDRLQRAALRSNAVQS